MRQIFIIFNLLFSVFIFSQEVKPIDSIKTQTDVVSDIQNANSKSPVIKYNPTKAGLYSAVLPGLGQYYNKKYWKIPIVLGGIGTGVGIILWNQKYYTKYRNAFIAELNGQTHEYSYIAENNPSIDLKTILGNKQDQMKRQRDYAIAITTAVYILNIVDAVVDAHLYEGRKDPDLAINPTVINDGLGLGFAKAGFSLNYRF